MTDAEGNEHAAGDRSVRRSSQYLAIPIGGLAPSHRVAPSWLRAWHRSSTALLTGAAVILAGAGAVITAAPRSIAVYADASHLYLGGVALTRAHVAPLPGYTMYEGAAVVLVSTSRPIARAAGAATLNGSRASGACAQVVANPATLTERCTFSLGGTHVTSRDAFDPQSRVWRRTYSDGETATFDVPAGQTVIPIPLPLGR